MAATRTTADPEHHPDADEGKQNKRQIGNI